MRYGLLALGVADSERLRDEWGRLKREVRSQFPQASIKGLLVEQMVDSGPEVFVGIKGRTAFGPILALGLGGVAAEITRNVQFARLPLDEKRVSRLVTRTQLNQVLADEALASLRELLLAVSKVWDSRRSIVEMDCNPIICLSDGLVVADGLALEET